MTYFPSSIFCMLSTLSRMCESELQLDRSIDNKVAVFSPSGESNRSIPILIGDKELRTSWKIYAYDEVRFMTLQ